MPSYLGAPSCPAAGPSLARSTSNDDETRHSAPSPRAGRSSATCVQRKNSSMRKTTTTTTGLCIGALALACLPASVQAANITSITGTWSSGSGAVLTGPGFAQPTNFTFTYPNTTGISYSFTDDGYYEEAQYRFNANGTEPHCVQAIVIWQHGNYTINSNNSISLTPIAADGRIQVQDPCASETNVITYYDQEEYFPGWSITNDINHNRYMLQLLRFDGALLPRMYLLYRPPIMLPTQQLWTTSAFQTYEKQHGGGASHSLSLSSATLLAALVGAGSLFWAWA